MMAYFSQKVWYVPSIPASIFSDAYLNRYEKANADMIIAYELSHNINQP